MRIPMLWAVVNPTANASYSATLLVHRNVSWWEMVVASPSGLMRTMPALAEVLVVEPSKWRVQKSSIS